MVTSLQDNFTRDYEDALAKVYSKSRNLGKPRKGHP
jgi:hypothetical protein